MQERTKKYLDPRPPRRKPRNHLRDLALILLGVGLVVLFFHSQTRFSFDSRALQDQARLERKLVFDGELGPKNLGLPPEALDPLYQLLNRELPELRQARIHIERQDRYAELSDATELRYWFVLTLPDGHAVRSVVGRAQRRGLVRELTRRMADDLAEYRDATRKLGKERIDSFTNTM